MCKQTPNTMTTLEGNIGPGVGDPPAFIHTRIKASTVHTDMRGRDSFGHAMLSRRLHLVDASSVAFSSPDPGAAVPPLHLHLTSLPISQIRCGVTVSHGLGRETFRRPYPVGSCDLNLVSGELCQSQPQPIIIV